MDSVTIICYGRTEEWKDRRDAIAFYAEGAMACDGSERDRYATILLQLMAGEKVCRDL